MDISLKRPGSGRLILISQARPMKTEKVSIVQPEITCVISRMVIKRDLEIMEGSVNKEVLERILVWLEDEKGERS